MGIRDVPRMSRGKEVSDQLAAYQDSLGPFKNAPPRARSPFRPIPATIADSGHPLLDVVFHGEHVSIPPSHLELSQPDNVCLATASPSDWHSYRVAEPCY